VPIDYAGSKHFVVLRGIRDGVVYIADPSAGNIVFSVEEFARWWDKNTLFIISRPRARRRYGSWR
jgi:predicted double-glycine peptidase